MASCEVFDNLMIWWGEGEKRGRGGEECFIYVFQVMRSLNFVPNKYIFLKNQRHFCINKIRSPSFAAVERALVSRTTQRVTIIALKYKIEVNVRRTLKAAFKIYIEFCCLGCSQVSL